MIEIIASVCLIGADAPCKDVSLTVLAENATPHQCFVNGQLELVKWAAAHPKWRIARWGCARAGQVAKL